MAKHDGIKINGELLRYCIARAGKNTTQVSKELGMTCHELTNYLLDNRVIYAQSGQYMLYADYARMGYAKNRTHGYRNSKNEMRTHSYLVWTERGRMFVHGLLERVPIIHGN